MPRSKPKNAQASSLPGWGQNPYGQPLTKDGEHNLKWWQWEFQRVHTYAIECMNNGVPFKPTEWTKHLTDQMKARGIDLSEMGNNKSDLLLMDHPEAWFEMSENQLKRMKEEATRLIKRARDSDLVKLEILSGVTADQAKKLKRAVAIIDDVIALQHFSREVNPDFKVCEAISGGVKLFASEQADTLRALHPMRVMLYARRSSASWSNVESWDKIMDMAPHLSRMCICVERAKELGSKGALVELPPEHCKTELGVSFVATCLAVDPEQNWGILHHKADHASNRLINLRDMMMPNNPMGRRFLALFPYIRVSKNISNQSRFTLERRSNDKDPSVRAFGINEAVEGVNLHGIWADDIVDPKERLEETTRKKTHQKFTASFMPRLRGDNTFFLMTYTPWHLEDTHGLLRKSRIAKDRNGRTIWDIAYFSLPIGTVDDPFSPIWDRQGRDKLLAHSRRLQDSELFDCLYRLNPVSQKTRIVQRLSYVQHSPEDEETKHFLSLSRMVLSIDPTATVGKKSDKAGVVYMAVNEMEPQIRIIEAYEIAANQRDLAAFVYEFTQTNRTDEIIVETIGGHHATADEIEFGYDIPQEKIVRITSHKNRDKATRLKSVASHFESGRISFVGQEHDGSVVGIERHQWMYDQILRFGATGSDHVVDAITQVAIRYASSLFNGLDIEDIEQKRMMDESKQYDRCPRMVEHMARLRRIKYNNDRPGSHVATLLRSVDSSGDMYDFRRWN